jgi:hypothetical protein
MKRLFLGDSKPVIVELGDNVDASLREFPLAKILTVHRCHPFAEQRLNHAAERTA